MPEPIVGEDELFQVSSQLESMSTRADGTVKLVFGTQELKPLEAQALFALIHQQGWLLFKTNHLGASEVPDEAAPEFDSDKSPSKRLRAALYVFWELNTNQSKPFNTFYDEWVEKKIREIKSTLPKVDTHDSN